MYMYMYMYFKVMNVKHNMNIGLANYFIIYIYKRYVYCQGDKGGTTEIMMRPHY